MRTYFVWYRVVGDSNHKDIKPIHIMVKIGSSIYVAGALGTWQKESENMLSFHVRNTVDDTNTFSKFNWIEVDRKKVDAENF